MSIMSTRQNAEDHADRKSNTRYLALFILFPIIYVAISMLFLNSVYSAGVFFQASSTETQFLYFTDDIFDMFWLLIAAIPNGIFAYLYWRHVYAHLDAKASQIALRIVSLLLIFAGTITVFYFTNAYNENDIVWSATLSATPGYIFYQVLEFISLMVIAFEATSMVAYILHCAFSIRSGIEIPMENLCNETLAVSMILFSYFAMLILSGVAADLILGGRTGSPALFPPIYLAAGVLLTASLSSIIYIFHSQPQLNRPDMKFFLGSVAIPFLAILLQIFQIMLQNL